MAYTDPEKRRAYRRQYYKTHPRKEYQKKYIQEHPAFREHLREYRRKYYKEHPRKPRNYINKPLTEAERKAKHSWRKSPVGMYNKQHQRAKLRGIPFTVTKEEFCSWWETTPNKCHYCHVELTLPTSSKEAGMPTSRTIDRMNNKEGYTRDNIVLCCHRCNSFKSFILTEDQMLRIGAILQETPTVGAGV